VSHKFIALALISLAVGITGTATIIKWSKPMPIPHSQDLPITTKGLDEFRVTLEVPYGGKSPHHVLLLNNSKHHIMACEIVFEFGTPKGEIYPARKVIAYSDLLNEQDTSKRKALLKAQPGIPPGTKWLIGMGFDPDLVPIKDNVLPLLDTKQLVESSENSRRFSQLTIRLHAVVFDTGEAVGPGATAFLEHLRTEVLEGRNNEAQ
jgi:hypothetical protein